MKKITVVLVMAIAIAIMGCENAHNLITPETVFQNDTEITRDASPLPLLEAIDTVTWRVGGLESAIDGRSVVGPFTEDPLTFIVTRGEEMSEAAKQMQNQSGFYYSSSPGLRDASAYKAIHRAFKTA